MRFSIKGVGPSESSDFGLIPEGEYLFKVLEVEDKATQVRIKFVGMDGAAKGRWVRDSLFATPKALPRLLDAAQAMGVDCGGDEVDLSEATLINKLVYLTVKDDKYEGRKRSKVDFNGYRAYAQEPQFQPPKFASRPAMGAAAVSAVRAAATRDSAEEAPF